MSELEPRSSPSARWVRGFLGNTLVVDSRDQLLVWELQLPVPRYLFRESDVTAEVLRRTSAPQKPKYHHPNSAVSEWFDIVVDDRVIEHGAWRREGFEDYLGVTWAIGKLDRWMEEEQEVYEHQLAPFVHIDALPSSRRITVSLDGVVVAESTDAVFLWETGLPVRYYLPRADVDFDRLQPSVTTSVCPYKGFATDYWSTEGNRDIAWSYPEPFFPYRNIAGRVAFLNESADIAVDGVPRERPKPAHWSARSRLKH